MFRLKIHQALPALFLLGSLAMYQVGCTAPDGVIDMSKPTPTPGAASSPLPSDPVLLGQYLYSNSGASGKGCASCHGGNAKGGDGGPTIIGKTAADITANLGAGNPIMQEEYSGAAVLTQTYINALAAYIATLQ